MYIKFLIIIIFIIFIFSINKNNIIELFDIKKEKELHELELKFKSYINGNMELPIKRMTETNIKYNHNDLEFLDYMDILV